MLKKTVEFLDFNGKKQETVLYFNLVESEIVRLDVEFHGGLEAYIQNLDSAARPEDILNLFEKVIFLAYGKKSEDGLYFKKSLEEAEQFKHSAAYNALFVSIVQDADVAASFFNQLLSSTVIGSPKIE